MGKDDEKTSKSMDLSKHLDWTYKQGRILTCEGKAEEYYTPERGFPFIPEELPHFHLMSNTTHEAFLRFRETQSTSLICGAWTRPLFMGAWEHTTSIDENVFNIQTNSLFIDLRIPTTKPVSYFYQMGKKMDSSNRNGSLTMMSDLDLRIFARQHVFGGYTVSTYENQRLLGTRHHCIDWNFVGVPRNRPNKWYVEPNVPETASLRSPKMWKEWAYATNDFGQHYYCERWERLDGDGDGSGLVLAMRKSILSKQDGILVVVGNHFNYIHDRTLPNDAKNHKYSSLVELVDECVKKGDRKTAESYLSIDAGHGTIDTGWEIDCAIQSWRHGTKLFDELNLPMVQTGKDDTMESCSVIWNNEKWDIIECSFSSVEELQKLFQITGSKKNDLSRL